jgi:cyclophilin family peptidyl-prolyl cis-trans isomerase
MSFISPAIHLFDRIRSVFLPCLVLFMPAVVFSDQQSARQAMENAANPLMQIETSQGALFVELFPAEAPQNVANFIALAEGRVQVFDSQSRVRSFPNFYDNMRFHRVIPGLLIQAGSPILHPLGTPEQLLRDEINASHLGLNTLPVIEPGGSVNSLLQFSSRQQLEEQLLIPLYRSMGIDDETELLARQFEIFNRLRSLTVMELYQNLGYQYNNTLASRAVSRGTVALANRGPNSNGPEFFIPVVDAPWLSGRYTIIGKVVEGMNIVDRINQFAVDPLVYSRQSTVIFTVRQL